MKICVMSDLHGELPDAHEVSEITLILQFTAYTFLEQCRKVEGLRFSIAKMNDKLIIIQIISLLNG